MSYERPHQHRDQRRSNHHHPYQRDSRVPGNFQSGRNDNWHNDRSGFNSPGHRFPHRNDHQSHRDWNNGSHHSPNQFPVRFNVPQDHRSYHSNGGYSSFAQPHDVSRNQGHKFANPSVAAHHYPQQNRTPDRNFARHSTGSYDSRQSDFNDRNPRRESEPGSSSSERRSTGASNDLQSRTLRVTGFHQKVTKELLKELFLQVGPVRNVVHRADHAFIEFQDQDSVAYALAAMDGVHMFGAPLRIEPKIHEPHAFRFLNQLQMFEREPELFGIAPQPTDDVQN